MALQDRGIKSGAISPVYVYGLESGVTLPVTVNDSSVTTTTEVIGEPIRFLRTQLP